MTVYVYVINNGFYYSINNNENPHLYPNIITFMDCNIR